MSIEELLEQRRICVCVGPGGVGKTTTAAAIALGMATRGLKVAVVTIDPARRLANALGLDELENEPRLIDPARLPTPEQPITGELWAMMLDPKRTFDELIDSAASSPEAAATVKANRIYRQLSTAVAGSQEFTAVAKLDELAREWDFDLLVLDTPPSHSALDFLEAPGRISAFLEGRALKAFLRPTGLGMRMLGLGATPLLGALRRVTGLDLVTDLTSFFTLIAGMTESFNERSRRVEALLRSPKTAFLLVTSAQAGPVEETLWFTRTLADAGLEPVGAVVNRFQPEPGPEPDSAALGAALRDAFGEALAERVAAAFADYRLLARRDAASVERLHAGLAGRPTLLVPQLDGDVHDVAGLMRLQQALFSA
jgi:anion-transporting  ArsA/GET3 family ATPase